MTEEKAASQMSGPLRAASRVYNLIWWKGERLGGWSSKQAGSEWRCPRVHSGQTMYTLSFLHFSPQLHSTPLNLSLRGSSPPLRCLDGFKMDLRFPGHLGWWSPLPQGLGRPLELLLEKNTKIMCLERKVSMKYWVSSQAQSGLAFLIEVINLLPALWNI